MEEALLEVININGKLRRQAQCEICKYNTPPYQFIT